MGNKEKLYLAAAIQYDMEDIGAETIEELAGYNRIIIKAPTGSGKNYFCMHVLPKMANRKPILFITSREATAEQIGRELKEIADSEGFAPSVSFCRIGKPPQGRNFFYGQSWEIEKHLSEYMELARRGFFRYIIMDECHSLTTDSTFASAPLTALEVLEAAAPDTTVILMSACPERVVESGFAAEYVKLDYSDCHKAEPQHVEIIQGTTAKKLSLKAGEDNKILYYVVSTKHAYELEKELNEAGIKATAITSQPDERKKVYTTEQEVKEREQKSGLALQSLREQERFPDNVDLIITTTKLREGVNVKDRRVKTIITELRDSVSLIQCAGRVRYGVENFYIIEGNRFCLESEYQDYYLKGKKQIENHNRTLSDYDTQEDKDRYIASVEKLHKGVLYHSKERDCFILNRFYMPEQKQKWADWEEWVADKAGYVRRVMEREQVTYGTEENTLIEIILPYTGRWLKREEKNELLEKLNSALPLKYRAKAKIDVALKHAGYKSRSKSNRYYWIEKVEESAKI